MADEAKWEKMTLEDPIPGQSYPAILRTWAAVIPLMALNLTTVVGNGIVIFMFLRMAKLRNFKNSFVASLAVADFLVGCTEPVSLVETAHGKWSGYLAQCHTFLVFRYAFCYASLLSVVFISVDRWWSIHHPFSYRVRRSKRLATWVIAAGWTISFVLHACPVISWELLNQDTSGVESTPNASIWSKDNLCLPPAKDDFILTTLTFSLQYVSLLIVLIVLNASVYFKISRRKATKIRRSLSTSEYFFRLYRKSSSDSENTIMEEESPGFHAHVRRHERQVTYKQLNPKTRRHTLAQNILHSGVSGSHIARLASSRRVSFDVTVLAQPLASRKTSQHSAVTRSTFTSYPCPTRRQSTSEELVRELLMRQDKKAACSLGVLVLVLVLSWCPLCICSIIYSYDSTLLPSWVLMAVQWVVAANSAANPFLYAIGNAEFRKVIKFWVGCVDKGPFKYNKAYLYHSIQLPTDQDTTRETLTSHVSKE